MNDQRVAYFGAGLGIISGLSSATQFRLPGTPGPAEVLLILWIFGAWVILPSSGAKKSPVFWFSLTLAFVGLLGYFAQIVFFPDDSAGTYVTILSVSVAAIVLITVESHSPFLILSLWVRYFSVSVIALAATSFILASLSGAGGLAVSEQTQRFTGFSSNPNQLAFFLVAAVLTLSLSQWNKLPVAKLLLYSVAGFLIVQTGSDSGRLALLAAGAALGVIWSLGRPDLRAKIFPLLAIAASLVVLWPRIVSLWNSAVSTPLREENDQLGVRQGIWKACLNLVFDNPVIGTGNNQVVRPGSSGAKIECHNLLIEVGTVSGLLPIFAFAALVIFLAIRLFRSNSALSVALWVGLLMVQFGNSSLRFSAFWITCAAVYWLSAPQVRSRKSPDEEPASRRLGGFWTHL